MIMYISHFKYNILSAEEHQVFKEILILYYYIYSIQFQIQS